MKKIALVLATSTMLALSGAAYAKNDNGKGNGNAGCGAFGENPSDVNALAAQLVETLGLKNKKELADAVGAKNWGDVINQLCGA